MYPRTPTGYGLHDDQRKIARRVQRERDEVEHTPAAPRPLAAILPFPTPMPAASYKPSTFYFRASLRAAPTKAQAVDLGLAMVAEHEALREWVREQGLVPPKWFVTPSERHAKVAGSVCPLPMRAAESATGA